MILLSSKYFERQPECYDDDDDDDEWLNYLKEYLSILLHRACFLIQRILLLSR